MLVVKKSPANAEDIRDVGWSDLLEEGMASHSVFSPGESHGQRSLVGYSPLGHKESDTTDALLPGCREAAKGLKWDQWLASSS